MFKDEYSGGDVVRLEPLESRHSEGLFSAVGNDDEAWRWMLAETPKSIKAMSSIVDGYLAEKETGEREPYAVIHKASGRVVGTTSFLDISVTNRGREIGSTIYSREFWRTKVNTETKLLLLTEAFEVKQCIRVCLKTDNLNLRSQAAIQRIGGIYEGTLRAHRIRTDGTLRDSMYYSILRTEWPNVKTKLQGKLA
ncbi:MAG: GNAT family protein [Actinomycetota bacterium]